MKPLKSQNYYEVLGIARQSSQEDIRRAFEICKHTFGNDSLATYSLYSEEENKEIFNLMSQAYETLCNPDMRREYDVFLARQEGDPERDRAEGERMVASMIGLAKDAGGARAGARERPLRKDNSKSATPAELESEKAQGDARYEKFLQSVKQFDGAVLKKIRGMQGLSLGDMAERTKIRITYLEYLEEENYEFLPAAVYIKGFVTNIAAVLELPAQQVAEDYMTVYRSKVSSG